jgi:ATP-dependent Clp protease ATP-binding subunit ClpA
VEGERADADTPVGYRACALIALSGAMTEAVRMSHQLVGIEHMLAGILISPSPEVASLFAENGVDLDEVLSDLRKNMQETQNQTVERMAGPPRAWQFESCWRASHRSLLR